MATCQGAFVVRAISLTAYQFNGDMHDMHDAWHVQHGMHSRLAWNASLSKWVGSLTTLFSTLPKHVAKVWGPPPVTRSMLPGTGPPHGSMYSMP